MTYPAPLPSLGSLFAPIITAPALGGGNAAPFPWMSSLFERPGVADGALAASRPTNRWLIRRASLPDAMYTIDIQKTPWEEKAYQFDLSALLSAGEQLASISAVTVDPVGASTVTSSGATVIDGVKVRVRLVGGALPEVGPWSDHVVHVRAVTTQGQKVEGLYRLRVLEAPVS